MKDRTRKDRPMHKPRKRIRVSRELLPNEKIIDPPKHGTSSDQGREIIRYFVERKGAVVIGITRNAEKVGDIGELSVCVSKDTGFTEENLGEIESYIKSFALAAEISEVPELASICGCICRKVHGHLVINTKIGIEEIAIHIMRMFVESSKYTPAMSDGVQTTLVYLGYNDADLGEAMGFIGAKSANVHSPL